MRRSQGRADRSGIVGFAMAEETPPDEDSGQTRWLEADVERAIAAAERAGLDAYRIEIAPDGTIAIVVGFSPETPGTEDRA